VIRHATVIPDEALELSREPRRYRRRRADAVELVAQLDQAVETGQAAVEVGCRPVALEATDAARGELLQEIRIETAIGRPIDGSIQVFEQLPGYAIQTIQRASTSIRTPPETEFLQSRAAPLAEDRLEPFQQPGDL
jgi:hypothetical protein